MSKVNVYLPDDLEREVRAAGVPISAVCQVALRAAVDRLDAIRAAGDVALPGGPTVTPRLADVLATGPATALDLLGAIVLHGENLGARALADLGLELPPPRRAGKRKPASGPTAEVREVLAAAYRVALDLQHGYLGTEHVVIALATEPTTEPLFAALGLDERAIRSRVARLLANPWAAPETPTATGPLPELVERFEAELQRLSSELDALRTSARRRPAQAAGS